MPKVVKREVVMMPFCTNAFGPRRDEKGQPSGPMFEMIIETVEAEPLTADEAEAVRRRMAARHAGLLA